MQKKIVWLLLLLLILAFLAFSFYYFFFTSSLPKSKIWLLKPETPKEAKIASSGFSLKADPKEAVFEAAAKVKEGLGQKNPDFLFLYSTASYDNQKVLEAAREFFGEKTKIYGGTSMLGVLTEEGFHQGQNGALAMLGLSSSEINFGVGGVEIDSFPSPEEAGKAALKEALKNAGMEFARPKIIFMTAAPGQEEALLSGIAEVVGPDVPVFGGSSADNDISGKWQQFANDKVLKNGVSVAVVFTNFKVSYAYEAGYLYQEKFGVITKASGRTIYEIDGRPAALVYNEWTSGAIEEKLKTGGSILSETTFWPLAKKASLESQEAFISIHPLSVNLPEKSLTVFAEVKTGEKIYLMHGDWQMLLNRSLSTPLKALISGNLKANEPYFALYHFCAGTMLAIPEEKRTFIPALLKNNLGEKVPFIGMFSFGEQGRILRQNFHGNLMNSIILFSP